MDQDVDYGPLSKLIGTWKGDKGTDWSPEKEGLNKNVYYETIKFTPVGEVENAEEQQLAVLHYHQVVIDKEDGDAIHNETGYWSWDAESKTVIHSFTIPRGVCVLAGGQYEGEKDDEGNIVIEVSAQKGSSDWGIIETAFMKSKATTSEFRQKLLISNGKFSYDETTVVEIYGKTFEHTDTNVLSLA